MLPVSLSFAAGLAILALWHALRISRVRFPAKIMLGDGDNVALRARMRAQTNFTEYAPFALGLVVLIELAGGSRTGLWAATVAFLLARVAHAFGMDILRSNPARAGGAMVTWLTLLALAIWAIVIARTGPVAPPVTML